MFIVTQPSYVEIPRQKFPLKEKSYILIFLRTSVNSSYIEQELSFQCHYPVHILYKSRKYLFQTMFYTFFVRAFVLTAVSSNDICFVILHKYMSDNFQCQKSVSLKANYICAFPWSIIDFKILMKHVPQREQKPISTQRKLK